MSKRWQWLLIGFVLSALLAGAATAGAVFGDTVLPRGKSVSFAGSAPWACQNRLPHYVRCGPTNEHPYVKLAPKGAYALRVYALSRPSCVRRVRMPSPDLTDPNFHAYSVYIFGFGTDCSLDNDY
jgi:hypothetical protein